MGLLPNWAHAVWFFDFILVRAITENLKLTEATADSPHRSGAQKVFVYYPLELSFCGALCDL